MLPVLVVLILAAAPADEQRTVLALSTQAPDVSPGVRTALSAVASAELRRHQPNARVFASQDIEAALSVERQRQLSGCTDEGSCFTEIANALGGDELLATRVVRLGSSLLSTSWLVDARRIDGRSARTVGTGQITVCGGETVLVDALRVAVAQAFGAPAATIAGACDPKAVPLAMSVAGGALVLGSAVGFTLSAVTKSAYDAQQLPGSAATVTRAQGAATNAVFGASLAAACVGAALLTAGLVGLASTGDVRVSVVPSSEGGLLVVGGSL